MESESAKETLTPSESSTSITSDKDLNENPKKGKLKSFFKNFLKLKLNNCESNPNLMRKYQVDNDDDGTAIKKGTNEPIKPATVDRLHRFLTINRTDNKEYDEYRTTCVIRSTEEFRRLAKEAIEKGNYDKIIDFYCWNFSSASNLIDLFVTDKRPGVDNGHDQEKSTKKYDPCYHVSTNWKFMKEVYNFMSKLV